jgi:hypothetical protein
LKCCAIIFLGVLHEIINIKKAKNVIIFNIMQYSFI